MGVLLPWTVLLHIQRSNPGKRVQMQFILLLIFVGSFAIGYLIRLIGGQVEQTLITVAFSLLCFLGLFMSFFDDTPERVILRNWNSLACGNRENLSTSMKGDRENLSTSMKGDRENLSTSMTGNRENLSTSMTDDLYASLLQSADDSASSQVDQLVALFQEEFFLSRSQLLRRYLAILVRWLLAVLSVSVPSFLLCCPDLPPPDRRPVVPSHRSLLASEASGRPLLRPPLTGPRVRRSLCGIPPGAKTTTSRPLAPVLVPCCCLLSRVFPLLQTPSLHSYC